MHKTVYFHGKYGSRVSGKVKDWPSVKMVTICHGCYSDSTA